MDWSQFMEALKGLDAPIGMGCLIYLHLMNKKLEMQHSRINKLYNRVFPEDNDTTPRQNQRIA